MVILVCEDKMYVQLEANDLKILIFFLFHLMKDKSVFHIATSTTKSGNQKPRSNLKVSWLYSVNISS